MKPKISEKKKKIEKNTQPKRENIEILNCTMIFFYLNTYA